MTPVSYIRYWCLIISTEHKQEILNILTLIIQYLKHTDRTMINDEGDARMFLVWLLGLQTLTSSTKDLQRPWSLWLLANHPLGHNDYF